MQWGDPGLGLAGRQAKGTLKALDRGDDVSSMGAFAEIGQNEAKNLSEIDQNYSEGANALEANQGGDNLNQINRMKDLAQERTREDSGRQRVTALSDLRNSATNTFQQARQQRMAQEDWQQQALMQARSNVFDNRRTGESCPV